MSYICLLSCIQYIFYVDIQLYTMQELSVLCYVLCGQMDGSALRYLLLLTDYIHFLPSTSVQEISSFFSIVYPFLQVSLV